MPHQQQVLLRFTQQADISITNLQVQAVFNGDKGK
jgi:hypothetical protein